MLGVCACVSFVCSSRWCSVVLNLVWVVSLGQLCQSFVSLNWFLSFCVWYFGDGDITLFLHLILQQLADSATVQLNSFVNF